MMDVAIKHQEIQTEHEKLLGHGPDWLNQIRKEGMAQFLALDWPNHRQEAWRKTTTKAIAKHQYSNARNHQAKPVLHDGLLPHGQNHLVFVDGTYVPELSKVVEGVSAVALSDAINNGEAEASWFSQGENDAFTALNNAFLEEGVVVRVARGTQLKEPIHIVHVATVDAITMVHPRHLIFLEDESEATVLEHYLSVGKQTRWTNSVTDIRLGKAARGFHYIIQLQDEQSMQLINLRSHQDRDSYLEAHSLLFGGQWVRNRMQLILDGPGADVKVNGLFLGHDKQHLDYHIFVDHAKPHCSSEQFVKGILDDSARGVFTGKVRVKQDAQKTDARQSNRNLLLSDNARIDTQPQLEIYADDVKCAHGATTGHLEEDAIFYLQTRGIDPQTAMDLLVYAFAYEVLDRIPLESVRHRAETILFERFSKARMIEEER